MDLRVFVAVFVAFGSVVGAVLVALAVADQFADGVAAFALAGVLMLAIVGGVAVAFGRLRARA